MSVLDNIPADVVVEMTTDMDRAFKVAGCEPACHCCGDSIEVGMMFKLAYIKTYGVMTIWDGDFLKNKSKEDEMLCDICTPVDLIAYKKQLWDESITAFHNRYSGYTRKHQ